MKIVESRLKLLIAEKEVRDRRRLGIRTIAAETETSVSTVQRLLNNTIKQVPLDDLAKLCKWLNCQPGDILVLADKPE